MESPKNFQSTQKPVADPALHGGDVVVPGTAVNPPPAGVRPGGYKDNEKGNVAEPAGNKDGKGNSATKPAIGAGTTPRSEPDQS